MCLVAGAAGCLLSGCYDGGHPRSTNRASGGTVSRELDRLRGHPSVQAEVYSDSQFVVSLAGRLTQASPAEVSGPVPHMDLAEPLIGMSRLRVHKVKSHNGQGHAAMPRLSCSGPPPAMMRLMRWPGRPRVASVARLSGCQMT